MKERLYLTTLQAIAVIWHCVGVAITFALLSLFFDNMNLGATMMIFLIFCLTILGPVYATKEMLLFYVEKDEATRKREIEMIKLCMPSIERTLLSPAELRAFNEFRAHESDLAQE